MVCININWTLIVLFLRVAKAEQQGPIRLEHLRQ